MKYCPGTLGITADGKAEISYAEVIDNNLYKFTSGGAGKQAANGVQWSPTSAVSGYSYPLQKGQIMIAGENAELYKTFATNEILRPVTEEWMEHCQEVIHGLLIR